LATKNRRSTASDKKDVVLIIGAGMAGLAAARVLHGAGFSATVIEGRERIGGRIWTDHSWNDTPVDLGASWIHGITGNPIAKLARAFNIPTRPTDYYSPPLTYTERGKIVTESDRSSVEAHFKKLLATVNRKREELDRDIALSEALRRAIASQNFSPEEQRQLKHCLHIQIEQDYAADASELSLWYWDEVGEFSGEDVLFPNGFDQLIYKLAEGLEIKLGHVVKQIEYKNNGVKISTNQGTFDADRVIVTLPLGVLQKGSVAFAPKLPSRKVAAIKKLRMGVLNKLYLRFPTCFWPNTRDWLEYIGQKPRSWATFLNFFKYTGKPILVGFNVGAYSRVLERRSDQEIVNDAMTVLRTMFGSCIPNPIAWRTTRWASDPFAGGAYSHIPPGVSGVEYNVLAEPVGERLFFAGEATSRAHYGTTHGAFLSGVRAAKQIQSARHPTRSNNPERRSIGPGGKGR
jgi:monoamine oxidase